MKKIILFITFLIFISFSLFSQNDKKVLEAIKIKKAPKIDGVLNDEVWKNIPIANDFIQYEPFNGKVATFDTEVKVIYNDEAIFIAAIMYDPYPDSILLELGKRDEIDNINSDAFAINLAPFNDDLNAVELRVSASGVQLDRFHSPTGVDQNWNPVWQSAVKINDKGWVVEFKIPYSAIRFPNKKEQVWGINFWRNIKRYREWSTYNFIDKEKNGIITQSAKLIGIHDIEPPLRLSFFPYISGYLNKNPENDKLGYSFNYGMDLKYGINESFTLDMTLIPDFGQVQSDDEILNLSPFEVRYQEKRQFFTEGTNLFNKGGIFYSRRIGTQPIAYYSISDSLQKGEELTENPSSTKLINATKISGRTQQGLGIGIFNAMTSPAKAIISDSLGKERVIETQSFTNYNIFVLDQSLKNNSFVSLINTNVSRKDYSANVTATTFSLMESSKKYSIDGDLLVSQKYADATDIGYSYEINVGKRSGNFQYDLEHSVESDKYDPNDLGYLQSNNEMNFEGGISYIIFKPFWKFLNLNTRLHIDYSMNYLPREYSSFIINTHTSATLKNHFSLGFYVGGSPIEKVDFYQARVKGWKYNLPSNIWFGTWMSSDYRKKIALDTRFSYSHVDYSHKNSSFNISLSPRIRLSDKFMIIYGLDLNKSKNQYGYATQFTDTSAKLNIIFGKRDQQTLANTINSTYIFNNKSSLSFRLRHYWSIADYKEFFLLKEDGYLTATDYNENNDINFNIFNIDLIYSWHFAPGSIISVVWKNSIYNVEDEIVQNLFANIDNTFSIPAQNSFSIKVLYYLDYQYFKKNINF
ncbi:MAG: DUF5916 domain-containing protein [Bacteroidota bacterium]|nr:DUF5916 domain-containing protein [Bacteroidota bacterium]